MEPYEGLVKEALDDLSNEEVNFLARNLSCPGDPRRARDEISCPTFLGKILHSLIDNFRLSNQSAHGQ